MSDSDSDGGHFSSDLMGFMFGNIDKHGNLENDLLDHVSKNSFLYYIFITQQNRGLLKCHTTFHKKSKSL